MLWSVISAVNNEQILKSCLLQSPDLRSAADVILQRGSRSAAAAYNAGIREAVGDLLVFVHQDVYLPEGWILNVRRAIQVLSGQNPDWGVLGVWGVTNDGGRAGNLYWTGLEGMAGEQFDGAMEVETLDELLLIVRRSSGLRFDESLPGFHMYGTDLCLEARRQRKKCYAISAFCIHNTDEYRMLPLQFWKAYFFMRRKWKSQLPVRTTCIEITRWCRPMIQWNVIRAINLALRRAEATKRVSDPTALYQEFVRRRLVVPSC